MVESFLVKESHKTWVQLFRKIIQVQRDIRISLLQDCAEQRRTKKNSPWAPVAWAFLRVEFISWFFRDFGSLAGSVHMWQCGISTDLQKVLYHHVYPTIHQSLETLRPALLDFWTIQCLTIWVIWERQRKPKPKGHPTAVEFCPRQSFLASHTECQKSAVCWLDFSVASHRMRKGVYRRIWMVCVLDSIYTVDYRPHM